MLLARISGSILFSLCVLIFGIGKLRAVFVEMFKFNVTALYTAWAIGKLSSSAHRFAKSLLVELG